MEAAYTAVSKAEEKFHTVAGRVKLKKAKMASAEELLEALATRAAAAEKKAASAAASKPVRDPPA